MAGICPLISLRDSHLPLLERHLEQALGLMGIAGIEGTPYLPGHRRTLIEQADVALRVVLQVKLAPMPAHNQRLGVGGGVLASARW